MANEPGLESMGLAATRISGVRAKVGIEFRNAVAALRLRWTLILPGMSVLPIPVFEGKPVLHVVGSIPCAFEVSGEVGGGSNNEF